jgi:hypothetical protein
MSARISSRVSWSRSATRSAASSGLHLLHHVGQGFVVEGGEHAGAVARREVLDDRREVSRVELRESGVGDAQAHAGDGRVERVHVLPVDVALGERGVDVARDRPEWTFDPQPPEEPGRPDVNGNEAEAPLDVVQADVVDADDLASLDVHDLLVEQVRLEQDLVVTLAELGHVDRADAQPRPAMVERGNVTPRDEDPAPVGVHDEAGHGRVLATDGDDQVGDGAQGLAGRIAHREADALAEKLHGGHQAGQARPPAVTARRGGPGWAVRVRSGPGGCRRSCRRV